VTPPGRSGRRRFRVANPLPLFWLRRAAGLICARLATEGRRPPLENLVHRLLQQAPLIASCASTRAARHRKGVLADLHLAECARRSAGRGGVAAPRAPSGRGVHGAGRSAWWGRRHRVLEKIEWCDGCDLNPPPNAPCQRARTVARDARAHHRAMRAREIFPAPIGIRARGARHSTWAPARAAVSRAPRHAAECPARDIVADVFPRHVQLARVGEGPRNCGGALRARGPPPTRPVFSSWNVVFPAQLAAQQTGGPFIHRYPHVPVSPPCPHLGKPGAGPLLHRG